MSTATLAPINASAVFEKSEITKKQLKVVHDTIANQLNDSDVRKNIRKELETMGKSVVAMEADFAKVYAYVKNLDDLGVILDQNNQVIRFSPEWKLLHDVCYLRMCSVAYSDSSSRLTLGIHRSHEQISRNR